MMSPFAIRRARPGDGAALALLGAATMLETYAELIDGADILAHCRNRHSAEIYEDWLADERGTIWTAHATRGAPIGYLVLTPATLPETDPHPDDMEVQRIYVLSRFHATGVAQALMAHAIAESGPRRLVLGVLKRNARAVAFYHRQGFREIGTRVFQVGASRFDDFVLARSP